MASIQCEAFGQGTINSYFAFFAVFTLLEATLQVAPFALKKIVRKLNWKKK